MQIEKELPPEADRWLDDASKEFDRKQATLQKDWVRQFNRWEFDPATGELVLFHDDGLKSLASAEILGSFSPDKKTWEWAWNNPDMPAKFCQKSLLVKAFGEHFGLEYLVQGTVPIYRDEEPMISYLCAIGLKATGSTGIFRGGDDGLPVYFLLFNAKSVVGK